MIAYLLFIIFIVCPMSIAALGMVLAYYAGLRAGMKQKEEGGRSMTLFLNLILAFCIITSTSILVRILFLFLLNPSKYIHHDHNDIC